MIDLYTSKATQGSEQFSQEGKSVFQFICTYWLKNDLAKKDKPIYATALSISSSRESD